MTAVSTFISELVSDLRRRPKLAEALAALIVHRPDVARAFDHTLLRRVVVIWGVDIAVQVGGRGVSLYMCVKCLAHGHAMQV